MLTLRPLNSTRQFPKLQLTSDVPMSPCPSGSSQPQELAEIETHWHFRSEKLIANQTLPMTKTAHRRHASGELPKGRRLYQHELSLLPAAGASPVVVARCQLHHRVEFYCHPRHDAQGDLEEVCIKAPQHCLQAKTNTKGIMSSRVSYMCSMTGQLRHDSGERRCTYIPEGGFHIAEAVRRWDNLWPYSTPIFFRPSFPIFIFKSSQNLYILIPPVCNQYT